IHSLWITSASLRVSLTQCEIVVIHVGFDFSDLFIESHIFPLLYTGLSDLECCWHTSGFVLANLTFLPAQLLACVFLCLRIGGANIKAFSASHDIQVTHVHTDLTQELVVRL